MASSYPTFIFILPDESKLITFNNLGINLTDTDGTNASQLASGLFESHYMYDDATGFIYVINSDDGNLWRNDTSLDFTSMSDQGNIITGGSARPPRIIKINNSRYLFTAGQSMKYTDNAFSSLTSITPPGTLNVVELLYEGGDNVMVIYWEGFDYNVYRSTNNGLTWTEQIDANFPYGPAFKI